MDSGQILSLVIVIVGAVVVLGQQIILLRFQRRESEYQTRYAKLHETRAEVIAKFHKRLLLVERAFDPLTLRAGWESDSPPNDETKAVIQQVVALREFFEENCIYFEPGLSDKVFEICRALSGVWADTLYATTSILTEQTRAHRWQRAKKIMSDEVPQLRRDIEDDFRKLLGLARMPKSAN